MPGCLKEVHFSLNKITIPYNSFSFVRIFLFGIKTRVILTFGIKKKLLPKGRSFYIQLFCFFIRFNADPSLNHKIWFLL